MPLAGVRRPLRHAHGLPGCVRERSPDDLRDDFRPELLELHAQLGRNVSARNSCPRVPHDGGAFPTTPPFSCRAWIRSPPAFHTTRAQSSPGLRVFQAGGSGGAPDLAPSAVCGSAAFGARISLMYPCRESSVFACNFVTCVVRRSYALTTAAAISLRIVS